jgi:hypothetical protein
MPASSSIGREANTASHLFIAITAQHRHTVGLSSAPVYGAAQQASNRSPEIGFPPIAASPIKLARRRAVISGANMTP